MNFNVVLDISSIIWDEIDFEDNKNNYYELTNAVSALIFKLNAEKPNILLRDKLMCDVISNFPYGKIPYGYNDFQQQTLSFLSNTKFISYSDFKMHGLISIPNLEKKYYNESIIEEVRYLISKIHSDKESRSIFFTFEYLWNDNGNLKTKIGENNKEHETIISDKENKLDEFFAKLKPIFEHNPKHDKTIHNTREKWERSDNKKDWESCLSCYNGKDTIMPQKLLSNGIKSGKFYYNYDFDNNTWVVFKWHLDNKYHAYDEYNMGKIPLEVRNHFNK